MLEEHTNVRQFEGEPRRRWFANDYFDLIVWFDESDEIVGFQVCYDKSRRERALTWFKHTGYMHHRVDDGEHTTDIIRKATPILVSDGSFDHEQIASLFKEQSTEIERKISKFVYEKVSQVSTKCWGGLTTRCRPIRLRHAKARIWRDRPAYAPVGASARLPSSAVRFLHGNNT